MCSVSINLVSISLICHTVLYRKVIKISKRRKPSKSLSPGRHLSDMHPNLVREDHHLEHVLLSVPSLWLSLA